VTYEGQAEGAPDFDPLKADRRVDSPIAFNFTCESDDHESRIERAPMPDETCTRRAIARAIASEHSNGRRSGNRLPNDH